MFFSSFKKVAEQPKPAHNVSDLKAWTDISMKASNYFAEALMTKKQIWFLGAGIFMSGFVMTTLHYDMHNFKEAIEGEIKTLEGEIKDVKADVKTVIGEFSGLKDLIAGLFGHKLTN